MLVGLCKAPNRQATVHEAALFMYTWSIFLNPLTHAIELAFARDVCPCPNNVAAFAMVWRTKVGRPGRASNGSLASLFASVYQDRTKGNPKVVTSKKHFICITLGFPTNSENDCLLEAGS